VPKYVEFDGLRVSGSVPVLIDVLNGQLTAFAALRDLAELIHELTEEACVKAKAFGMWRFLVARELRVNTKE
jgi:hypothetical protein